MLQLSDEQKNFVEQALRGTSILVDACIGSGKTTAIQKLCDMLPQSKKILYLTYNRLLKLDAKKRIQNKNILVQNYHGFAYQCLKKAGIKTGAQSELIQNFVQYIPKVYPYDVLILDEYQDIDSEISQMLEMIRDSNPKMQIIAVGDMEQKIYDRTKLEAEFFIRNFLGKHLEMEFTQCFRLSKDHAAMLGRIWHKTIHGVNQNCHVEIMNLKQATEFLSEQEPEDILCLGKREGLMAKALNKLESDYPKKFNKNTVYASIRDEDNLDRTARNQQSPAIFTTYDSSKGMERPVCCIFDFTEDCWGQRTRSTQYIILRNIFCVAASRGKRHLIFVRQNGENLLDEKTLSTPTEIKKDFRNLAISEMFDFKYKEDIEECFDLLNAKKIEVNDSSVIVVNSHDGYIDLSPCNGIYQEAKYFSNYNIDQEIRFTESWRKIESRNLTGMNTTQKILYLTHLETRQDRYEQQVKTPFITEEQKKQILGRLSVHLSKNEQVQIECQLESVEEKRSFSAFGFADAVKGNTVYELKFVSELSHEHFLQCACYMVALNKPSGRLWNVRNNEMYEITIPDRQLFMDRVVTAATKGVITKYHMPQKTSNVKNDIIKMIKDRRNGRNLATIYELCHIKDMKILTLCMSAINRSALDGNNTATIFAPINKYPVVERYMKGIFFQNYRIELVINPAYEYTGVENEISLSAKAHYLAALETGDKRFLQGDISRPLLSGQQEAELLGKLSSLFSPDANAQIPGSLELRCHDHLFPIKGYADILETKKTDKASEQIVHMLKFEKKISDADFLECACMIMATNASKGLIWNIHRDEQYEIRIPDPNKFQNLLEQMYAENYTRPDKVYTPVAHQNSCMQNFERSVVFTKKKNKTIPEKTKLNEKKKETRKQNGQALWQEKSVNTQNMKTERFAVLDVETTYNRDKVISIGIVIGENIKNKPVDQRYFIIEPNYLMGGMYTAQLKICPYETGNENDVITELSLWLSKYNVSTILAYNAAFDYSHLPQLQHYIWCDIMKFAAYKQYNHKIDESVPCSFSGRMKKGYGAESITRILSGDESYTEQHNALYDARDEYRIMQLLGYGLKDYQKKCAIRTQKLNNETK